MTPWLAAGACAVLTLTGDVSFDGVGWVERIDAAVLAHPGCDGLDLHLPDGVDLTDWSARVTPVDDKPYWLDGARAERVAHDPDGTRQVHLHLPELETGDRVRVRLTRTWRHPTDYRWTPGLDQAAFAELKLPRGITPILQGVRLERRIAWSQQPTADTVLTLPHPWAERTPAVPAATAATDLTVRQALAQLEGVRSVPHAWFGRNPVAGDEAIRLGVMDDRGFSRTLAALTSDGPEPVHVVRPEVTPGLGAASGAPEFPVQEGDTQAIPSPMQAIATDEAQWDGRIAIHLTGKDPVMAIGPGRSGVFREIHVATFPADAFGHVGFVSVPMDGTTVDADATQCDHVRITADAVWLAAAPGTSRCEVSLVRPLEDVWAPIPPTWRSTTAQVSWTRPDGSEVQGDVGLGATTWHLSHLGDLRLLDSRDRLVRAWADRVLSVSLPEPAVPVHARGGRKGWALAEATRDLIGLRAEVHDLPIPGSHPRKLVRARRTRLLTPAEAAITGATYLRQGRVLAEPMLVRSPDHPAAGELAPHGFDHALIRVQHEGGVAWIDPACSVCGPFELPPMWIGAEALGPDVAAVPRPRFVDGLPRGLNVSDGLWTRTGDDLPNGVGWWEVEDGVRTEGDLPYAVRWTWAGAAALSLRLDLLALPSPSRRGALAQRMSATHAPVTSTGTADAGQPIVASGVPDAPFAVDPLSTAAPGFVGVLAWSRPAPPAAAAQTWSCDTQDTPWAWRAAIRGETLTEQLLLRVPALDDEAQDALLACRAQLAEPMPDAEPDTPPAGDLQLP